MAIGILNVINASGQTERFEVQASKITTHAIVVITPSGTGYVPLYTPRESNPPRGRGLTGKKYKIGSDTLAACNYCYDNCNNNYTNSTCSSGNTCVGGCNNCNSCHSCQGCVGEQLNLQQHHQIVLHNQI